MNLEAAYRAIHRKVRTDGVSGTIKLISRAVLDRLFRRDESLFYVNLPTYTVNPKEIAAGIVVLRIEAVADIPPKLLEALAKYAGDEYIRETNRRLENGWSLFLAMLSDELAGGGWAITNKSGFMTKVIPLLDGDVSLIDFFTLPASRGKNVYPYLLSCALTEFKAQHFLRAYGYTTEWNVSANRGIVKAGFLYFMKYEAHVFGRREFVIWKSARRGK